MIVKVYARGARESVEYLKFMQDGESLRCASELLYYYLDLLIRCVCKSL